MAKLGDKVNRLIRRVKQGDTDAFNILMNSTYNHLKVIALNYLYDTSVVDDVLNDAYMKAYVYINSADEEKDGYNWLCKIVQNKAYDYNNMNQFYEPIDKVSKGEYFDNIDEAVLNKDVVLQALKKLNATDYRMVYLRFWECLSLSEISAIMGIKKSTVYKRLRVLIVKLKKYMN